MTINIERLITEDQVDIFYVGNNGNFDRMVNVTLQQLKKKYPQISHFIVLAYINGKKRYEFEEETKTIYPDGLETVPQRFAISHRNKWMVNHSDYVIGYIRRSWGGAAQFFRMAERKGKTAINLYVINEADVVK